MLKNLLKNLKLHESTISMVLGAIVIIVMGVIVVNYFRGLKGGETLTGETAEQPLITPGQGAVEYTVAEGETLWGIAEKQYGSGYNWVDIADTNSLTDANMVMAGTKLTIPDVEPRELTATPQVTMEVGTEESAISGASYTVVRGDSLWNIAVRAYGDGYKWTEIANANKLVNPNLIHAGNVLTLPR